MDIEIVEVNKTKVKPAELNSKSYYDSENIKYFTIPELSKLLDGIDDYFYQMVFLFLFESGARVDEARQVKFSDIDFFTKKIKIKTLKQRKKNIYRVLVISDKLLSMILLHQKNKGLSDSDFIFAKKPSGNAITRQAIDKRMKNYVKNILGESYLDKAHPHALRHTRAIQLLDGGMNIVQLKKFLGHATIQNTLIYLKYSDKQFNDAIQQANKQIYGN